MNLMGSGVKSTGPWYGGGHSWIWSILAKYWMSRYIIVNCRALISLDCSRIFCDELVELSINLKTYCHIILWQTLLQSYQIVAAVHVSWFLQCNVNVIKMIVISWKSYNPVNFELKKLNNKSRNKPNKIHKNATST